MLKRHVNFPGNTQRLAVTLRCGRLRDVALHDIILHIYNIELYIYTYIYTYENIGGHEVGVSFHIA